MSQIYYIQRSRSLHRTNIRVLWCFANLEVTKDRTASYYSIWLVLTSWAASFFLSSILRARTSSSSLVTSTSACSWSSIRPLRNEQFTGVYLTRTILFIYWGWWSSQENHYHKEMWLICRNVQRPILVFTVSGGILAKVIGKSKCDSRQPGSLTLSS